MFGAGIFIFCRKRKECAAQVAFEAIEGDGCGSRAKRLPPVLPADFLDLVVIGSLQTLAQFAARPAADRAVESTRDFRIDLGSRYVERHGGDQSYGLSDDRSLEAVESRGRKFVDRAADCVQERLLSGFQSRRLGFGSRVAVCQPPQCLRDFFPGLHDHLAQALCMGIRQTRSFRQLEPQPVGSEHEFVAGHSAQCAQDRESVQFRRVVAALLADRDQRANRRLARGILLQQGAVLTDRFFPTLGKVAE